MTPLLAAAALAPAAIVAQAPATAPFALDAAPVQGGVARGTAPAGTVTLTLGPTAVPVAPDRRFLIAFDRDAAPSVDLVAVLADGRTVRQTLAVAPRAWRIERLDTLPRGTQPTEEFTRRRAPELARIAAARAVDRASDGWRQRFVWPATGRISGLFGSQRIYRGQPGAYHGGVDVARPTGTPVAAPADGIVALAADAPFTLEGNLLMIDHGMGLVSAFLHLSRIDVRPGDTVRQGQIIGAIGATGRATGPHLHWGMTWRGEPDRSAAGGGWDGGGLIAVLLDLLPNRDATPNSAMECDIFATVSENAANLFG